MINLTEERYLEKRRAKLEPKSFFKKYRWGNLINELLIEKALLILSAYFSFRFWETHNLGIYPEFEAVLYSVLVSGFVFLFIFKIKEEYLDSGVLSSWLFYPLICLMIFNIYTDMQGVKGIVLEALPLPTNTEKEVLQTNYDKNMKGLDEQERTALEHYVLPKDRGVLSLVKLRTKYRPKTKNKYHSQNQIDTDNETLSNVQKGRSNALNNLNADSKQNTKTFTTLYNETETERENKIIGSRFGAAIVSFFLIVSLFLQIKYYETTNKENGVSFDVSKETPKTPIKPFPEPEKPKKSNETETKTTVSTAKPVMGVQVSDGVQGKVLQMKLNGLTNTQIRSNLGIKSKGTITKCLQSGFFEMCKDVNNKKEVNEVLEKLGLQHFAKLKEVQSNRVEMKVS